MNNSIESRLTALADALERRAMQQQEPIDGLSRGLFDLRTELAALDEQGKMDLLTAMNNLDDGESDSLRLSTDDINKFIESIVKG